MKKCSQLPVIWHPSIQFPSALILHSCLQVVYSIRLGAKAVLHPEQVTSSLHGHHRETNNRPTVALTPTDYSESPVSPVCRSLDGGDEAGAAGENPLWRSENRQIGTKPRVSSGHQSSKVRLKNHLPTVQSYENPGLRVKRPNAGRTVFILIFHLGQLLSCFVYSAPQRVTVYALCKYWSVVEPFKSLDEDKDKTVRRQIQQIERWREHLAGEL